MGKTDKLFAAMKGDHDLMRAKQEQARPRDMTELQENQQHYTNLLRLARTADLSDIHRQQIVYIAGTFSGSTSVDFCHFDLFGTVIMGLFMFLSVSLLS